MFALSSVPLVPDALKAGRDCARIAGFVMWMIDCLYSLSCVGRWDIFRFLAVFLVSIVTAVVVLSQ